MAFTSVDKDVTCVGDGRFVVVPSPIWPLEFLPQVHRVPSLFNAIEWSAPAAMAITLLSVVTWTGLVRCMVVPSPICPLVLPPQLHTVPSFFKASECTDPAATAMTFESVVICDAAVIVDVVF